MEPYRISDYAQSSLRQRCFVELQAIVETLPIPATTIWIPDFPTRTDPIVGPGTDWIYLQAESGWYNEGGGHAKTVHRYNAMGIADYLQNF